MDEGGVRSLSHLSSVGACLCNLFKFSFRGGVWEASVTGNGVYRILSMCELVGLPLSATASLVSIAFRHSRNQDQAVR